MSAARRRLVIAACPPLVGAVLVSCGLSTHGLGGAGGGATTTSQGSGGAVTTSTSSASSSTGGSGGAGNGGSDGALPICGNGKLEGAEGCDDNNLVPADGCTLCARDPGFTCAGEPSQCAPIPPQIVTVGPALGVAIKDPNYEYDGSLSKMQCADVTLVDQGFSAIQAVEVTAGIDHTWVGDLVIKLVSPQGTISTMMSRPGLDEPADDYDNDNGDDSNFSAQNPITFRDGAPDDAETMGNTLSDGQIVCRDDQRCVYAPNPGSGPGNGLSDFAGESPAGTWRLCVADPNDNDSGAIQLVTLSVLAW